MRTDGRWLQDNAGRALILRGVNVSGSAKVPAIPAGDSRSRDALLHPESGIFSSESRFPLDVADEHFARLVHSVIACCDSS